MSLCDGIVIRGGGQCLRKETTCDSVHTQECMRVIAKPGSDLVLFSSMKRAELMRSTTLLGAPGRLTPSGHLDRAGGLSSRNVGLHLPVLLIMNPSLMQANEGWARCTRSFLSEEDS